MTDETTPTSDEPGSASTGSHSTGRDVQYIFMTVKSIRGREVATRSKWESQGWEFVRQTQGTLRTELNFRKVKPRGVGAYFAQGYAAFRRLEPKTQKVLLGGIVSLVAVLVLGGIIAGAMSGGDEAPQAAVQSEEPSATPAPSSTPAPTTETRTPEVKAYSYDGPKYEVVAVDEGAGMRTLDQYWVYTAKLDHSTDAYKKQVKLIVADVARTAGTAKIIVEVVTDKEIIQAEAADTSADFMDSHDADYWKTVMVPKQASDYIASYTGGIDRDAGEVSDAESAFEIVWFIASDDPEFEQWKPAVAK